VPLELLVFRSVCCCVIVDKLFNFGPRAKNNWYALMRPAWLEIHDRAEVVDVGLRRVR
jgi:hypothetical protein